MLVGNCQCGNCKETSREHDKEYGQDYVSYECEECGYYWEGYVCLTLLDKE